MRKKFLLMLTVLVIALGGSGKLFAEGVAKVGNTEYATIGEAIAAWTNNTTLTLLADVTLSDVVTLSSQEHHYLALGTYTMTAASGKNAIELKSYGKADRGETGALTITADPTNSGSINAGSKACIYYKYDAKLANNQYDRPIIYIKGGVFVGNSYSGISCSGHNSAQDKCATFNISGGTFNCGLNLTKAKLLISGGTFNYSVSCTGGGTSHRQISGGTFKAWGFMTADAASKFWVGTSQGNYNVGVHVDDNGYLVVGGAVVNEAGDMFEASSANYGGWNSYLQYSSAKDNGLYYTSVKEAFADNNTTNGKVTVYADEVDMAGISYKGTIVVPEGKTVKIKNAPEGLKTEGNAVIVKPVAKIGDVEYLTLEEAFATATEGQTITLLADATPALTSQRAITKAAVIDLGGKTLTLTEDDLYFGTTTFKNGTIVVDPSVKPSTAVFWMFANQTLTFDAVKVVATGVTGTYLIGLDGNNSDLNLLNGSEILVENTTALDLDIICVNASTGNDINVENSKVNVTNLDGRVFFRGNYTVKDSEVNLAGITKAGFRIEAGQTLSIEGTSKVNIEGEPRDGGIHLTDLTATYTKAETATVNATVNEVKAIATINGTKYASLQAAINAVKNGEEIILSDDCAETVTFTQTKEVSFVLNGNNKEYTGSINITARAGKDAPSTLVIKNFNFKTNAISHDFIKSVETNYYPNNITISGCTFSGTTDINTTDYAVVAVRLKSANNIKIENCTGTGLHSFLQNTAGWNVQIDNVDVTNSLSGFAMGTVQGANIKNCDLVVNKSGIRFDAQLNNNAVITDNEIKAFIPVVVRKASVDSNITFNGTNEFTATNIDGLWCAIGTSEYETNGTMPTAATGKVRVTLNDTELSYEGVYGNYYELAGEGTAENPYLINSVYDLKYFRDKVDEQAQDGSTQFAGKYFKLTADLDLAGINWNPIGSMSGDHGSFKGVFDGGNHTISNLNCEQAGNGLGLFARTAGNAEIKNLKLNNVTVKSTDNSNYVGGVVGNAYASTKINNVHVSGTINIAGRGYIGGIAGHGYVVMDKVSVVANEGSLITSTFWCAGGILGYAGEGSTNIMNANVEGITITSAAGGLGAIVGMAEDNNGTQPISGSNLSAKNVEIKTYVGAYGTSYANYALGYLYGGNETSILTGELSVENVNVITSTGEKAKVVDAVANVDGAIYFNITEAFAAAQEGDNVAILKAGTYALKVKDGLTITGDVDGVEFANIGAFGCNGANVTFNNVTFTYANNSTYKGLQHSGNLVYNNCTFNGQVFLYGASETFNNCTFNTTDSNNYNVWTYGAKEVAFNECTFNSAGKSVLIYAESATVFNDVTVTACTFKASTAVDGKAAIEMDSSLTSGINLTISNTTATGFGNGNVSGNSLWNNKKGNNTDANNDITVKVNGETVLAPVAYAAKIGNVGYQTLAAAVSAAQTGDVVKVFEGTHAVPTMKAGITIEGVDGVILEGTLSGTLENLTLKNLHIKGANAQRWAYAKGNLLFENVTFEATSVYALHFDGITAGATLTYKDCTIIGWAAMSGSPASCTFDGCTFKGNGTYGLIRTYFDATITDCTFDVANVNTNDVYQDGIHAVSGAIVTVNNCTNVNGDMNDVVNVSGTSVVVLDGVEIKNAAKIGEKYYRTLAEAYEAVQAGETLTLLADINLSEILVINKAITLDGNGKTLTSTAGRAINVSGADGVKIQNLTINASGERAINIIQNATNVTIDNVTAKSANYTVNVASSASAAVVAITNSNLTGLNVVNVAAQNADVTIDNTTITTVDNAETEGYSSVCLNKDGVNGKIVATNTTINLTGSNTNGSHIARNGAVGGYVSINGSTDDVAVDVAYISYGNNYYGFQTIEAAIAKASTEAIETIELLRDVDASAFIAIDKSLTINGNGHNVTSSATRVFRVTKSNVEVTLNNVNMVSSAVRVGQNDVRGISIDAELTNVKLTLNGCSVYFTDASANDWSYAVNVSGNGTGHTVTVNGGTYEGANVINVNGANNTVVVKDATLDCIYLDSDAYAGACIWVLQNQGSSVEATGNTFNGDNAVAFNLGTGTALTESNNTDNTTVPVAKVGNTYYKTIAAAVNAAQAGETVKVFVAGTYAVPSMKAGITIEGVDGVIFEGTLSGTLENLTMKNIHIKGGNAQRWAYAKGNLVFENVTFEATSVYALHFDGIAAGTNLTYKDCTIIGWAAMGGSPASCTFDGCTIKGNGTYGVIRTYFDATIQNCKFDVANVNTTDAYQDGIHAVEGATVTVNGCTNVNGNMNDVVNVHGTSMVVLDGKKIRNVAKIGGVSYTSLQAAIDAANDDDIITLSYVEANGPIEMNAALYGKDVTISGTAKVDWSKGFLFVGRGGEGNATLTFDNANLTSASNSSSYGIHVSGREKNTNNKYDGTVVIKNSTIELDYLINRGTMTLDNGAVLTVKNGFGIAGRPASETENNENATATITLNNASILVVNNHNGMGLGQAATTLEGYGIMNINSGATFETKQAFKVSANGTMNNAGTVNVAGALTNNGTINFTDDAATLATTTEGLTIGYDINQDKKVVYREGAYKVVDKVYVAQVGTQKFETLQAAVNAVEDGGTITLIGNVTFTETTRTHNSDSWYDGLYYIGDKSFTIDLGGFTIGQDGSVNDYLLNFKNDGAKANTIILKNGTVDAGTKAYCALATASSNSNKITINTSDINFVGNNSNGAVLKIRGGAELNVNAGTIITGKNNYVGIEAAGTNTVVNINEGVKIYQNGRGSYVGSLVGVSGNGTVNVYGGEGTSAQGGFIAMTSGGTINVSGGEWIANTNGTISNDNKGVLIAQSEKGAKSIVNVTGGTFRGGYNCYGDAAGDAQINISGGNYNADPSAYVIENFSAIPQGPTWVVKQVRGTQTRELASAGWYWFSSYIDIEGEEGLEDLQEALNGNGKEVRGQDGFTRYFKSYNSWAPGLKTVSTEEMYMINTTAHVTLILEGNFVAENRSITLNPGWNWIGYPVRVSVPVEDALANYRPEDGDMIKSKSSGFSVYNAGAWWPSFNLQPGEGYKYDSKKSVTTNFVYSTTVTNSNVSSSKSNAVAEYHWTPAVSEYAENMVVIAMLDLNGEYADDSYEVAAFANGECRGSARPIYNEKLDKHMLFMTVYGDEVEEMTFKCYDANNDREYALANVVVYSNDAVLGSIREPYIMTCNTLGIDEATISDINIYPNPTTTDREINLQATCDKVEVFNTLGVKVAEYQNVDTIDALETAGTYVIRVTLNGDVKHCRLVVK